MNSLTTKALVFLLSTLVILMIASQIYYRVNEKHRTEEAVMCDINENIPFKGVVIRDESVLKYSGSGVYEFLYKDGSKVTSGNNIAKVYSDESALQDKKKADELNETADMLEKSQNPATSQYVQPEVLNSQIDVLYKDMMSSYVLGDFSAASECSKKVYEQMCIYDVVVGKSTSYNEVISELRQEAKKLSSGAKVIDTVTSDKTGYFVSYCDGYEGQLNTKKISDYTKDDIEAIVNGTAEKDDTEGAIGKVFDDYSSYIIGIIPSDSRIAEGDTVNIMTSTSNELYKMDVVSVKDTNEDGKSIIILSCNRLDSNFVISRVMSLDIVFENFKGIKVSREAIRFKDGQKGVYVILGNETTFKKIDVIYEGSDYVVSKYTADEDYLLLYDQILLEAVSQDDDSGG